MVTTDQEQSAPPADAHYQLRRNRIPRYRCGTCGLRVCACNHLIQTESTIRLPVTIPQVPPNVEFGPFNYEREPVQMVRCITADLLHDKYNVIITPGILFQPANNWWLLISANKTTDLVRPNDLRSCLDNLRTATTPDLILCFHIVDLYRGKVKFQWWLELIIAIFAQFPRIRFLDEWTHTFPEPTSIRSALSALDVWSRANIDNRSLPYSVWQDLNAIARSDNPFMEVPNDMPVRKII